MAVDTSSAHASFEISRLAWIQPEQNLAFTNCLTKDIRPEGLSRRPFQAWKMVLRPTPHAFQSLCPTGCHHLSSFHDPTCAEVQLTCDQTYTVLGTQRTEKLHQCWTLQLEAPVPKESSFTQGLCQLIDLRVLHNKENMGSCYRLVDMSTSNLAAACSSPEQHSKMAVKLIWFVSFFAFWIVSAIHICLSYTNVLLSGKWTCLIFLTITVFI